MAAGVAAKVAAGAIGRDPADTPAPPPPAPVLQFIAPPAPVPVPSPAPMPEPAPTAEAPASAAIELDERARDSLEREPLPRMALPAARLQALTSAIRAARSHADGLLARRASRDVMLCLADSTSAASGRQSATPARAPSSRSVGCGPVQMMSSTVKSSPYSATSPESASIRPTSAGVLSPK